MERVCDVGELRIVRDGYRIAVEGMVDVREEVVRCRDCEKAVASGDALKCDSFAVWDGSEWDRPHVEPDGFCAWGKRREAI